MAERINLKKSLKDCNSYFPIGVDEDGINPLSKTDCEIIVEINALLKKLGANEDLLKIINKYKSDKDEDVLQELMSYNNSFSGNDNIAIIFVQIADFTFNVSSIYSIGTRDSYDKNKLAYYLIINETSNEKIPYANKLIKFNSSEQREQEIETLKQKLKQHSNVIFL